MVEADSLLLQNSRELPTLREMLDSFAKVQQIGVGLFTTDCQRISGSSIHSRFCHLIRNAKKDGIASGSAECEACDKDHFPFNGDLQKPYRCHAGLIDFSVPLLTSKQVLIGAIFGGQVIDHALTKEDFARFRDLAQKYGIEETELFEAATQVKKVSEKDIQDLVSLTGTIAKTITQLLERKSQEHEFILQLSSTADVEQLCSHVIRYIQAITCAEACSIFLRDDPHSDTVVLKATSSPFLKAKIGKAAYAAGEGLTGWVFQQGQPILISSLNDLKELDSYSPPAVWRALHIEMKAKENAGSFLAAPLLLKGIDGNTNKILGVIRATREQGLPPFCNEDLTTLQGIARLIVNSIESAQNQLQARSDALAFEALSRASKLLNMAPDPSKVFDAILSSGLSIVQKKPGNCTLCVLEHVADKGKFVITHGCGTDFRDAYVGKRFSDSEGLAGEVLRTQKYCLSHDVQKERHYVNLIENVMSALVVPVWLQKRIAGVITIASDASNAFQHGDAIHFQTFADHVAVALEKAQRHRRATTQIDVLNKCVERIILGANLSEIAERVLAVVNDKIEVAAVSLFLIKEDQKLYLVASTDAILSHRAKSEEVSYKIGQGLTGWVALSGRPLRIDRVDDPAELRSIDVGLKWENRFSESIEEVSEWKSFLAVPIIFQRGLGGQNFWGVLRLARRGGTRTFSVADEEIALSAADYAAVALTFASAYLSREMAIRGFAHDAGGPIQTLRRDLDHLAKLSEIAQKVWITDITKLAEYLAYLIDTYVLIGRGSEVRITREVFEVSPLIDNILWMAFAPFEEKSQRVHAENHVPLGLTIKADKAKFYIAIYNLALNSVKVCNERLTIEFVDQPDTWEFRVYDDGPGIDLESIPGEVSHRKLGLPIVRMFAKAHGGDLGLHRNTDGKPGTVAIITLPKPTELISESLPAL